MLEISTVKKYNISKFYATYLQIIHYSIFDVVRSEETCLNKVLIITKIQWLGVLMYKSRRSHRAHVMALWLFLVINITTTSIQKNFTYLRSLKPLFIEIITF